MKGDVQQYTFTHFSAMTWIYSPHSVFSFNQPENPSLYMLWKRSSMHPFREIFFFLFFLKLYFSETTLHGFYSLQLFKPRLFYENENLFYLLLVVMLWHDQCGSPPYTNCSFQAICLAIIVFSPIPKAGDTRLAQTHHSRLIRIFRVQRTIQEIKAKLLEYANQANWDSIKNLYAAPLFCFQVGGSCIPTLVARAMLCGCLEVSSHGTERRVENWMMKVPVANQISPKHKVFLWQQVNTLGSLRLGRYSMGGQK